MDSDASIKVNSSPTFLQRRGPSGLITLTFLAILFSCIEPYNPPAIEEVVDLLVVDGFINASDNTAPCI